MPDSDEKLATCRNCGELYAVERVEHFGDACSLQCGIELAWERQSTEPREELPDIHRTGF